MCSFPDYLQKFRVVEIKGVDRQADGGTHVRFLDEIGKIVFVRAENKRKDNRRVYFRVKPI